MNQIGSSSAVHIVLLLDDPTLVALFQISPDGAFTLLQRINPFANPSEPEFELLNVFLLYNGSIFLGGFSSDENETDFRSKLYEFEDPTKLKEPPKERDLVFPSMPFDLMTYGDDPQELCYVLTESRE